MAGTIRCKRDGKRAREAIDRVLGYVNKLALREAGEMIVFCNRQMPISYEEYLRLGGRKRYSELQ